MGKFWLIGCTVAYNKQLATYDTEINACAGLMTDQPRFIKYSMPIYYNLFKTHFTTVTDITIIAS